jgi:hypothetical protein
MFYKILSIKLREREANLKQSLKKYTYFLHSLYQIISAPILIVKKQKIYFLKSILNEKLCIFN